MTSEAVFAVRMRTGSIGLRARSVLRYSVPDPSGRSSSMITPVRGASDSRAPFASLNVWPILARRSFRQSVARTSPVSTSGSTIKKAPRCVVATCGREYDANGRVPKRFQGAPPPDGVCGRDLPTLRGDSHHSSPPAACRAWRCNRCSCAARSSRVSPSVARVGMTSVPAPKRSSPPTRSPTASRRSSIGIPTLTRMKESSSYR